MEASSLSCVSFQLMILYLILTLSFAVGVGFYESRNEDRSGVDIFRCSCLCSLIPPLSDM